MALFESVEPSMLSVEPWNSMPAPKPGASRLLKLLPSTVDPDIVNDPTAWKMPAADETA